MKILLILFALILTPTIHGMQERFMEPEAEQQTQQPIEAIQIQEPVIQQEIAPAIEEQAAPRVISTAEAQRIAEQKKKIKTLASFLTSKRLIKKLHVIIMRSAKPSKELLRNFFFYCDFHKDQLVKLKECINEYTLLVQKAIPISARTGFYLLESPQIKKIMELTQKGQINEVNSESLLKEAKAVDEQLAQDDPILNAQIQDLKKQFELFNNKWESFFVTLAPYIQAHMQLHREELQKNVESFMISIVLRNLGPVLGLGIEGYTKIKNIDMQDELIMKDLLKEIHNSALANKAELEETIIACAQETVTVYGEVFNDVLKEALKRTR